VLVQRVRVIKSPPIKPKKKLCPLGRREKGRSKTSPAPSKRKSFPSRTVPPIPETGPGLGKEGEKSVFFLGFFGGQQKETKGNEGPQRNPRRQEAKGKKHDGGAYAPGRDGGARKGNNSPHPRTLRKKNERRQKAQKKKKKKCAFFGGHGFRRKDPARKCKEIQGFAPRVSKRVQVSEKGDKNYWRNNRLFPPEKRSKKGGRNQKNGQRNGPKVTKNGCSPPPLSKKGGGPSSPIINSPRGTRALRDCEKKTPLGKHLPPLARKKGTGKGAWGTPKA